MNFGNLLLKSKSIEEKVAGVNIVEYKVKKILINSAITNR